jgi:hypothetical protein
MVAHIVLLLGEANTALGLAQRSADATHSVKIEHRYPSAMQI